MPRHVWVDEMRYSGLFSGRIAIAVSREYILAIPRLYGVIGPYARTHIIPTRIAARVEESLPVGRPLAIDVMLAVLARRRGGKENKLTMGTERFDESSRRAFGKVLRDLEA